MARGAMAERTMLAVPMPKRNREAIREAARGMGVSSSAYVKVVVDRDLRERGILVEGEA